MAGKNFKLDIVTPTKTVFSGEVRVSARRVKPEDSRCYLITLRFSRHYGRAGEGH